jgi:hypothetical protein
MQRRQSGGADAPVYTTGGEQVQLTIAAEKAAEMAGKSLSSAAQPYPARVDLRSPDSAFSAARFISDA